MARVTLVRLPYSDIYGVYGRVPRQREIRPPLGLMYIAAALESEGHKVAILDGEPAGLTKGDVLHTQPDVVGITATTPEIHQASRLALALKRANPDVLTVLGGPHVSALPASSLWDWVDYVVVGEGERALPYIVAERPRQRTVAFPDAVDLDGLPLPARHLVDYRYYNACVPDKGLVRMDVVMSARGCPYRCCFCFNQSHKPRFRSPELVVEEIAKSQKDYKIRLFMFLDDTLTLNREHIIRICLGLARRGLDKVAAFCGWTRANLLDKDLLAIMKRANFVELSTGVETGNQGMLDEAGKGVQLEQYRNAYRWMRGLGIQTRASFVLGLPGETHESIRKTVEFAKSLDLVRVSCNILTPYPGTEIYERAVNGDGLRLLTDDWSQFKRWGTAVVETDGLSAADLERWQRRFLMEFYTQPKVLRYHAGQFLRGNRSEFYYRPVLSALKWRLNGD